MSDMENLNIDEKLARVRELIAALPADDAHAPILSALLERLDGQPRWDS